VKNNVSFAMELISSDWKCFFFRCNLNSGWPQASRKSSWQGNRTTTHPPDCTKNNKEQFNAVRLPSAKAGLDFWPCNGRDEEGNQTKKTKKAEKRLRHTENTQERYYCTDVSLNKYALCIIKEGREEQNSQELLPRENKKKLKLLGGGEKSHICLFHDCNDEIMMTDLLGCKW